MVGLPRASAGRYQPVRRLAVGGMGEIFLARETGRMGFTRLVVIKRMLPEIARKPAYVDMFVDEARIVGQLSHPNICQVIELGEEDGVPFIALEYVRGDSLSSIWDRAATTGMTVPRAVTLRILADTAWALHHAHEACDADGRPLNVIHRDISPHNVMVSFHGDVKLMDFGIARAENRLHRTDTGKVKGKIAYMAPEQLRGQPLDRRADVFAVGVMLWELTLGRRLFGGGGEVETLQKAAECRVPPPRTIDPTYPERLESIVMNALAQDASRRTTTAGEIADALLAELAALGGAERGDVAALMRQLFPEDVDTPEDTVPTRTWIDSEDVELFEPTAIQRTATPERSDAGDSAPRPTVPMRSESAPSAPRPTVPMRSESAPSAPRPTVPMRSEPHETTGRPTVPMRSEPSASVSPAAVSIRAEPARARRRWLVAALAALIASGVALVFVLSTSESRSTSPTKEVATPPAASSPGSAVVAMTASRPQPSRTSPASNEAPATPPPANEVAASGLVPSPPPPSRVPGRPAATRAHPATAKPPAHPAAGTESPRSEPARPESPPGRAAPPAAEAVRVSVPGVVDIAPATETQGTLAVSSEQTGVVEIDGVRHKSTPFQIMLPTGHHEVVLVLGEGAGTLRASANVVSGRKTKCKAARNALVCSLP